MYSLDGSLETDSNRRRIALKRLYREVAKRVHPDLTVDDADRGRRQRLMADANQAFANGDADWLKEILEESIRPRSGQSAQAVDLLQALRGVTLRTRLYLKFMDRFEGEAMKADRSLLAQNLLFTVPYSKIEPNVLNFFEELYLFIHDRYLDEELIWGTFGFSVVRWWAVCREYVGCERNRVGDETLFGGFQSLALWVAERDAIAGLKSPTLADLIVFLEGERKQMTI